MPRLLASWPPEVRVLATSREALDPAEPGLEERVALDRLAPDLATSLFLSLAAGEVTAASPDAPAVGDIVRRCEGLPLALELAARLTHHLPVGLIAPGIELHLRSVRLGETPRHESLAAALDQSWHLLTPRARRLLARLSVLPGPLGQELATQLALEVEGPIPPSVIDELERKSLVTREDDDETPRYRLLALVREHALDRLPEERRAVLGWLTGWVERLEADAEGPLDALSAALRAYRVEEANLRAAARLATSVDPALAARLLPALMPLWIGAGPLTEALDLMRAVPETFATAELRFRRALVMALVGKAGPHEAVAELQALVADHASHARGWDLLAALLPEGAARAAARREADRLFGDTPLGRAERLESEAAERSQAGLIAEALTLTEAALSLYLELGRGKRALVLRINRGSHLRDLGRDDAARVLGDALADAEAATFELAVLYAGYNLAFAEADRGRSDLAAAHLDRVISLGRRQGSLGIAARAGVWHALIASEAGTLRPALERALAFAREVDDLEATLMASAALERLEGRDAPTPELARALDALTPMVRAHVRVLAPASRADTDAFANGIHSALVRLARGLFGRLTPTP